MTINTLKTSVVEYDNKLIVRYHNTNVVIFDKNNNTLTLNSGGYKTVTTKIHINQAANQYELPFSVYQKDFQWYVTLYSDKGRNFFDKIDIPFINDSISIDLNSGRITEMIDLDLKGPKHDIK